MPARTGVLDPVLEEFLHQIAPIRERVSALILFGSRARGDNDPFSDYDVLVVLERKDRQIVDALYDATMEVLYKTGRLISLKIYRKTDFERSVALPTPFMANVLREGVRLG
jgi:predicted nucleotidyltransferase